MDPSGRPVGEALGVHSPCKRPDVPETGSTWPRNPIDNFVLARLEAGRPRAVAGGRPGDAAAARDARSHRPAADARRDRRVPRATRSPHAYEKVVDRLLQSPRYGERMALPLARRGPLRRQQRIPARRRAVHVALARLGDRGVQQAICRSISFTIEQLAGDLLPNPTLDQKIATGFNRNHRDNARRRHHPRGVRSSNTWSIAWTTTSTVFLGADAGLRALPRSQVRSRSRRRSSISCSRTSTTSPRHGRSRSRQLAAVHQAPTPEQQEQLKDLDAARRGGDEPVRQVGAGAGCGVGGAGCERLPAVAGGAVGAGARIDRTLRRSTARFNGSGDGVVEVTSRAWTGSAAFADGIDRQARRDSTARASSTPATSASFEATTETVHAERLDLSDGGTGAHRDHVLETRPRPKGYTPGPQGRQGPHGRTYAVAVRRRHRVRDREADCSSTDGTMCS